MKRGYPERAASDIMTVETGFVRDLQDNPTSDDVRLIFCDWLADQGDDDQLARRELILIQSELDGWVPDLDRRRELQRRETALLLQHSATWLGELPSFALQTTFRSGLVDVAFDAASFTARRFVLRAEELFDRAWIGRVRIDFGSTPSLHLPTCPALARVRQLDLSGLGLTDQYLGQLVASGNLDEVVSLDLANNVLTDLAVNLLTEGRLPHLRELDLRNNQIHPESVRRLLGSSQLPELRQLEVHGNDLTAQSLLEVAAFCDTRGGIARRNGLPVRLVNSVGIEFALIPAGVFLMGSPDDEPERSTCEGPQHEVEISRPFYLSIHPITQRQYAEVIGSNPSHFTRQGRGGPSGPNHPVEMVTWGNAGSFCEMLSQLEPEILLGHAYRLPTEAQWEHACRAGTFTPYHFGSSASSRQANFLGQHPFGGAPAGAALGQTSPVGSYAPNAFGLYDTHGNVWEWCADYYDERFYTRSGRRDPTGPRSGTRVSARGGSWSSHGAICRSASRDYWYGPHYCRDNIGFRIALTVPPGPASR